jgi:glycosyl transferase family 25
MMKCLLINLDRSPDRLEWMTNQLHRLDVEPTRVAAVDGKVLSSHEISRWESVRHPRYALGPGEFACFLSHRKAWEMAVAADGDWSFIAEDDIHIARSFKSFLAETSWIPKDADIIKAETAKQRVWMSADSMQVSSQHRLSRLRSAHGGSAAYFVSRRAARRLLELSNDFCTALDQLLFNPQFETSQGMIIYQIDPAIAVQDWVHEINPKRGVFKSLLLTERSQLQGAKQAKSNGGWGRVWYKVSNPPLKASRRLVSAAANALGTHSVKKVPFANV